MKEYIEREEVLKHKRKMSGADFGGEFWDEAVLCEDIRKIPTADVASVVHGRWLDTDTFDFHCVHIYQCSNCRREVTDDYIDNHKFCLHCGAKMDGGNSNGTV